MSLVELPTLAVYLRVDHAHHTHKSSAPHRSEACDSQGDHAVFFHHQYFPQSEEDDSDTSHGETGNDGRGLPAVRSAVDECQGQTDNT